MERERIVIRITPTPAVQDISEDDFQQIVRITKLPPEKVRDRISQGKGLKIATYAHPKLSKLIDIIKGIGFAVSTSSGAEEEEPARQVEKKAPRPAKVSPKAREISEWPVGTIIENLYEVTDIKYGGMGEVYVVRHLRWNTMLAVKSLYHRLRANKEDRALFVKEAETWIDIGFHPNIAACYYVRNIQDSPRIFIEYADGGALHEYLAKRGQVGWDVIIDLMVQVCDGLGHAHGKGLVHRDVKPANCMLTKDGTVKVTDFGLTKRPDKARALRLGVEVSDPSGAGPDLSSVTATGMGTPGYMAPEMWIAESEVGPGADIYAFGVMFFEICCGRKPFVVNKGEKPNKLALAHVKMPPPKPRSIRDFIPQHIEDIILKCLEKHPSDRFLSFGEIRDELVAAHEEILKTPLNRPAPDELRLLSDALNNRAVSMMDLRHEDEARKVLDEALESDPHHPEAVYNRGVLNWLGTKDLDRELVIKMEEVTKTPEYAGRGGTLLARCLLMLGDAEAAVSACRATLSSDDAGESILKSFAIALIGTGLENEAIGALDQYVAAFPNDDEALGWLLAALTRAGKMETALSLRERLPESSALARMSLEEMADCFVFSGLKEAMILRGHGGWVNCVGHSLDTRKLITGSRDRTIKVWDADTGHELKSLNVIGEPPDAIEISTDSRSVAIAVSRPGVPVVLLDLEAGRVAGNLAVHEPVTAMGFSPDGQYIVTVERNGWLRVWDIKQLKPSASHRIPRHNVAALVFGPEAEPVVFFSGMDRVLRRFSAADAKVLEFEARPHKEVILFLSAWRDGSRVVSGGRDKKAVVWDGQTGSVVKELDVHQDQVSLVALNPLKKLVASYDAKAGIKLWDYETGLVMRTFFCGETQVNCLQFSPDGKRLMAGGRDMVLRVWDVGGRPIAIEMALAKIRPVKTQMVSDREFNTMLATARKAMKKRAFATAYSLILKARALPGYERSETALEMIHRMKEHGQRAGLLGGWNKKTVETHSGVMDLDFSPSAINFLTAQSDHTIRMWSTKTGECLKVLKGHTNLVAALSFSINGREAVSGGDDRCVRTWDLHTGKNLLVLQGHTDSVSSVAYSPDGQAVLSGSWDGTMRLWRLSDGSLIRTLKGHEGRVCAVAFTGDSGLILSGGADGVVKMWDAASGRVLRDLKGHRDRVNSVAVSFGGDALISGSADGTARLWDARRGMSIRTLEVDGSGVRVVGFSPEGEFALTGGNDTVLRIWDLGKGTCLRDFQGHSREITAARFSADGHYMISASLDGTVIVWVLDWKWDFRGLKTPSVIRCSPK